MASSKEYDYLLKAAAVYNLFLKKKQDGGVKSHARVPTNRTSEFNDILKSLQQMFGVKPTYYIENSRKIKNVSYKRKFDVAECIQHFMNINNNSRETHATNNPETQQSDFTAVELDIQSPEPFSSCSSSSVSVDLYDIESSKSEASITPNLSDLHVDFDPEYPATTTMMDDDNLSQELHQLNTNEKTNKTAIIELDPNLNHAARITMEAIDGVKYAVDGIKNGIEAIKVMQGYFLNADKK